MSIVSEDTNSHAFIADVSTNGMTLIWDKETEYKPTGDFIHAIGNLMLAEIRMNRELHKDFAEIL